MESLRNYIKENRAVFDDKEPSEGHFERFEERLDRLMPGKQSERTLRIRLITIFSVAASVLLIVAAVRFYSSSKTGKTESTEQANKTEFSVTNQFYSEQMNQSIEHIQCKLSVVNPNIRNQLEKDLNQIVTDNKQFVRKMQNENDEGLAVFYLVKHYKTNLRALKFINDKLGNDVEC